MKKGLLVGMHFRPPAKIILAALATGQELEIRPEPENPYDEDAKAIWLDITSIPEETLQEWIWNEQLQLDLLNCGWGMGRLTAAGEIQLGYLAREGNKDLVRLAEALGLEAAVEFGAGEARLAFGPNGEPLVEADENAED